MLSVVTYALVSWHAGPVADATPSTPRQRARTQLIDEIKQIARKQLAEHGAAGLSLRAVARELGMVSSALYRYFPSRDELLTALIIDAYQALGEAAEAAEADCPRDRLRERWLTTCRAVRGWALAHPQEYALLYGSPVPGYHAPTDTITPAGRVADVLLRILTDALKGLPEQPPPPWLPVTRRGVPAWAGPAFPPAPAAPATWGLAAWTVLFGTISFELFGHYANVIADYAAYFESAMHAAADVMRLPPDPPRHRRR